MLNVLRGLIYRSKNQIREWMQGKETRFGYDLSLLEPMIRTAYLSLKPVGFRTRVMLTERVVEYPVVFQSIPEQPTKIIDIGSGDSPFPYHLACLGHEVHAVDVLPYPLSHPNLHTHQCDALHLPFEASTFSVATAISSLEHFGLGGYGDPVIEDAPFQAKAEILRVLKPKGILIVSFPVGRKMDMEKSKKSNYWVFTASLLDQFAQGLKVVAKIFFAPRDSHWLPCSFEHATNVDSYTHGPAAVGILVLQKSAS